MKMAAAADNKAGPSEASTSVPPPPLEEPAARFHSRGKRHGKKKISLVHLLKVICSSQETCLDWLKNKGLIPRVMFCPNCCRKMKFETSDDALDGYVWICKECQLEPPQFSSRHGSWLEDKEASLVDILLFTYLWSHGFSDKQIARETNMSIEDVKTWNEIYNDICDALSRRKATKDDEDSGGENKTTLDNDIEDILTRLDEFTSLVDMVRGDNALCLNATLPEIHKKCDEMEKVFQKIDRLEQMIQVIKQNLDQMEEKVAEAEEHLDSSSMKKIFNSLQKPLFSKKPGESKKHIKYEPPKIFSTAEFFPNSQPLSPSAESSSSVEQTQS